MASCLQGSTLQRPLVIIDPCVSYADRLDEMAAIDAEDDASDGEADEGPDVSDGEEVRAVRPHGAGSDRVCRTTTDRRQSRASPSCRSVWATAVVVVVCTAPPVFLF
jgi:hypothetical protein